MSMLMTDQPGDQANGEPTPDGDGAPMTKTIIQRDAQRHALRELVELSEQCATDEADIERRHDEEVKGEDDDFERKTWAADQRAKQLEENVRAKYDERSAKIESQFKADTVA